MSFRLFGSFLALCVPTLVLAQTTVTITPGTGEDNPNILGFKTCSEKPTTDIKLYDVTVTQPPAGGTLTIKLGTDCTNDTECDTLVDAIPVPSTATTITLNPEEILGIINQTNCLGDATPTPTGIDEQLRLFVEVTDPLGITQPTKVETKAEEDLFIDTVSPFAAENPKASGGENVLNISWEANPENDDNNQEFTLEQEDSFRIECRITNSPDDFAKCGAANGDTAVNDVFKATVTKLNNDTLALDNGVSIDVQIITIDQAGNESEPTAIFTGTPQDVIDFGENFNGAEQGGCAVGHGEGQLLWVGFLIVVILLLRKNKNNEAQI